DSSDDMGDLLDSLDDPNPQDISDNDIETDELDATDLETQKPSSSEQESNPQLDDLEPYHENLANFDSDESELDGEIELGDDPLAELDEADVQEPEVSEELAEPEDDELLIEEDLIDEGLIDDELITDEIDLADDTEEGDELTADLEQLRADTPSIELDEYPELELDEALAELNMADFGHSTVQPSQTEKELQESLSLGSSDIDADLEISEDDFIEDFELDGLDDEFGELAQSGIGKTIADLEADLQSIEQDIHSEDDTSELDSKFDSLLEESDEGFMLDDLDADDELDEALLDPLEHTDFDSLLSELEGDDEIDSNDLQEFELDFDNLLAEESLSAEPLDITEPDELDEEGDYLDIEQLLEESDDQVPEDEPYDKVKIDLGLSEFDQLLASEPGMDVDSESGGFSAKLDLARAYLEIEDYDNALKTVQDVIDNGPADVQQEAGRLLNQLK
ncbi:FimV/HubP family polar landmark protein, partial [Pseudoalteromonas tunicata]|uniref:FimV/HubP family polar landmark protein n=1 Tax=Pseudoalteromonas tunicata TaxID=314281 RepID=UPI00273EE826